MRSIPVPLFVRSLCWPALLLVALVMVSACESKSPEEHTADLRSRYTAQLNSFVVESVPLEPDLSQDMVEGEVAGETAGEAAEPVAEEEGEEGEEGMEEELVPTRQDVLLDILIQSRSLEPLAGLTLDVSQADSAGAEKAHYRIWVDTSSVVKGRGHQILHRIEDIDYEEGDGFHVEVRHPVAPEERSEYREFSATG